MKGLKRVLQIKVVLKPPNFLKAAAVIFIMIFAPVQPVISKNSTENTSDSFFFKNNRKSSVTLRFNLINNLIVIPVSINDSPPLNFIVDTGLNTILITELAIGEDLNLQNLSNVKVRGLGGEGALEAYHSKGNTLEFAGIKGKNQEVLILKDDVFHLSSQMGDEINGIFGYNIFRDFIVEINYFSERIKLHDPSQYSYSWWKDTFWNTKPIEVIGNKPYIELKILKQGKNHPVRMLIDTGASHAMWLYQEMVEEGESSAALSNTILGAGLSGKVYGGKGCLEAVKFGEHRMDDVVVGYPDFEFVKPAIGLDGRDGSIGADMLNRFNLIFDYYNEKISYRRNIRYFNPFRYDMSGMDIVSVVIGYPEYEVSYVRPHSPAYRAGIEEGDRLLEVNNISVDYFTLSELQGEFKRGHGREVRVRIQRGSQILEKRVRLEDILLCGK